MAVFWILATLMTAVAMAFVLVPMLRARARNAPSRVEANLEVLRGQRREIEADVAQGLLPQDVREEALAELVTRAEYDLAAAPPGVPTPARQPWILAGIAAVAIPAIAFGFYVALGNPMASDDKAVAALSDPKPDDPKIVAMVEGLARKVKDRPDDAQGWALLARSMTALGRFKESADAYANLVRLMPKDAQVLADYADSLAMAQGRTLAGRPTELALQALALDPANPKALALAGTAAVDSGDYPAAIQHWQKLASVLPPESPDQGQIQEIIGEIRTRAARSGRPLAGAPAVAQAASPADPAAKGAAASKSITGSVALAFNVAGYVKGGETLFIFARSEGGPRMPLAVVRASARAAAQVRARRQPGDVAAGEAFGRRSGAHRSAHLEERQRDAAAGRPGRHQQRGAPRRARREDRRRQGAAVSLLEGRGLACARGFATLFRDVSFRVAGGEWVAVRGPNGSGKTTLLRCAAGLTRADSGEVTRDGALLYSGHLPGIKDDLTAEENLRGALALQGEHPAGGAIGESLARAGLAKRRHIPARRLSAGQRRRIGLARLMLDPAPVWILDEPLTALDDEGQALFTELLTRHLDRGGLALLATHHDLAPRPARELRIGA